MSVNTQCLPIELNHLDLMNTHRNETEESKMEFEYFSFFPHNDIVDWSEGSKGGRDVRQR